MQIRKIREAMGLTQKELAGYLGIRKGQLALAEWGHSSLPFRTMLRMGRMKRKLEDTGAITQLEKAILEEDQEDLPELLAKNEAFYSYEASMLERKLQKLKGEYGHCVRLLTMVDMLRQIPVTEQDSAATAWLDKLENRMVARLRNCGSMKQASILLRLKPLRFVLGELEKGKTVFLGD